MRKIRNRQYLKIMSKSWFTTSSIICFLLMFSCKTEPKSSIANLTSEIENKISEIPFNDILTIMPIFIKYFTSCNERNIDNFSGIGLRNYILSIYLPQYCRQNALIHW